VGQLLNWHAKTSVTFAQGGLEWPESQRDIVSPVEQRLPATDFIMEALAKGHDGCVQMIDTAIVRVHREIETRLMGLSRDGPTTEMRGCVDLTDCLFALNRRRGEDRPLAPCPFDASASRRTSRSRTSSLPSQAESRGQASTPSPGPQIFCAVCELDHICR
jgi:hypothetical protein